MQVPSQHLLSEFGSFIRVRPDWLEESYSYNVYLSFRLAEGGDRDLADVDPGFVGKVCVYGGWVHYCRKGQAGSAVADIRGVGWMHSRLTVS